MCDTFLILKTVYFTGCTIYNTPFVVTDHIKDVIRSLEEVGENFITWFSNNQMRLNPDKCNLLLNTKEQTTLKIGNLQIKNSLCKKSLGINIGYKLNLAKHNAFIKLQFNYYPLIWMYCNRYLNNKINNNCTSYICALCTTINDQTLKKFSKKMALSLFTIKISDF